MQLTIIQTQTSPFVDDFVEKIATLNLLYYAMDAANEMEFDSIEEVQEAVKRAMELCISAEISLKENFQRVYKSSYDGILNDWRLSSLAYKLVCLSGRSSNPNVARLTILYVKNEHLNHF